MAPLDEIAKDLRKITPKQIKRVHDSFAKADEGDVVLGVAPMRIRRLWALSFDYHRQGAVNAHALLYEAETAPEKAAFEAAAMRFSSLEELTRHIAWMEMRDFYGEPAWVANSIGMRHGFLVVIPKEESELKLIGPFPLSMEKLGNAFKTAMRRMLEKSQEEAASDEVQSKPKIQ